METHHPSRDEVIRNLEKLCHFMRNGIHKRADL